MKKKNERLRNESILLIRNVIAHLLKDNKSIDTSNLGTQNVIVVHWLRPVSRPHLPQYLGLLVGILEFAFSIHT